MFRGVRLAEDARFVTIVSMISCLLLSLTAVNAAAQSALQFDGVDDYVDIGPWPELTSQIMAQPVTYEFWLSSSNTTDTLTLIGAVNTGDSTFYRISLNMDGMRVRQAGGIKLLQRDAGGVFFRGGTASNLDTGITDGQWHHLAVVFDVTTASLTIYVDGVSQELSFLDAATATNVTDFEYPIVPIGARNVRGVIDQNFQGLLDEVRIWSYARTEAEILENMTTALAEQPDGLIGYWQFNEGDGTIAYDSSAYGRDGLLAGPTWTTDAAPVAQLAAFHPVPPNGAADVPRDVVLGWSVGQNVARQNVYFGDDLTSVSAANTTDPLGVLVAQDRAETTYAPPAPLEFGRTYYWRVDEVGGDTPGRIWSFTVEPVGYPLAGEHVTATASSTNTDDEGPEKTINGSGLNVDDQHSTVGRDMWLSDSTALGESAWIQYEFDKVYALDQMLVWNHNSETESLVGFGIKEAVVESSLDGEAWTAVGDPQEFGRATGTADYATDTAIDLGGAVARYVRITAVSNWGGLLPQFGLSEVRFFVIPMAAREPQPADGDTNVNPNTVLAWRAGRQAVAHDVSFGTDQDALTPADTVSATSYDPGPLSMGTTYYWRIDEINDAAVPAAWEGDVWAFSTLQYFTIDDFESYDDDENAIFDTWLDGFINETGSTVGYFEAPFAERTIVNSGRQSMPLEYVNDMAPFYSEAEYDLDAMDLSANGADTLRLFVIGQADNVPEPLYVAIADATGAVAVVTHPDANITTAPDWTEWLIPYSDLAGVNLSRVAIMYIGIGDRDNPTAGGTGLIFIDDVAYGHPAVD